MSKYNNHGYVCTKELATVLQAEKFLSVKVLSGEKSRTTVTGIFVILEMNDALLTSVAPFTNMV